MYFLEQRKQNTCCFVKKTADIPISLKEYLDIESKLEVNNFHSKIAPICNTKCQHFKQLMTCDVNGSDMGPRPGKSLYNGNVIVLFSPNPLCEGRQPAFSFMVTLLPGSVGLSHHLPGSPEPYSGCRSYFRQSRILTIQLPFIQSTVEVQYWVVPSRSH